VATELIALVKAFTAGGAANREIGVPWTRRSPDRLLFSFNRAVFDKGSSKKAANPLASGIDSAGIVFSKTWQSCPGIVSRISLTVRAASFSLSFGARP